MNECLFCSVGSFISGEGRSDHSGEDQIPGDGRGVFSAWRNSSARHRRGPQERIRTRDGESASANQPLSLLLCCCVTERVCVCVCVPQLCATLGSTGVCSFDRLDELGPICECHESESLNSS